MQFSYAVAVNKTQSPLRSAASVGGLEMPVEGKGAVLFVAISFFLMPRGGYLP